MTNHLSPALLSALADGELSPDQLAVANEHLAGCQACTSSALSASLLKTATARAGKHYAPPPHLQDRLTTLVSSVHLKSQPAPRTSQTAVFGWLTAAILLCVFSGLLWTQRRAHISTERAALSTEVFDQHLASLAGNMPPQVLSTDRHTVKPWFQGKLPFSFNLPETLPQGTTLDGANLVYLDGHPVAQLLYSIGKHHVSVFVREKEASAPPSKVDRAGYHVQSFNTHDLEMSTISDVDPARLAELAETIRNVQ